jgi:hypothetical protein
MIKYNLIGGPFYHAHSSTWWKHSKYIEWKKDSRLEDATFYVDAGIHQGMIDNFKGKKYAWNLESRAIFNVDFIFKNIDSILEKFELIFTSNKDLIDINPNKIKFVPADGTWIENPKLHDKSKILSMITSRKKFTVGQDIRMKAAENIKNMDLYGRGFKPVEKKEEGLIDYMFSISVENDSYDNYFTEKILDCFATGTIPIYWGCPSIGEFFDERGILFFKNLEELNNIVDKLTPDLYYSKMEYTQNNLEKVMDYLVAEDYMYEKYLKNL